MAQDLIPMTSLFLLMKTVNYIAHATRTDFIIFPLTVPGVVSDLTGQPKFTSIVLTWSAPQEPYGVIISYEVTYRVSDGNLVTTNTTDLRFTIPSLTPGTNITEISVSAYTSVGRGDPIQIPHLMTLAAPCEYNIINHHVRISNSTSVILTLYVYFYHTAAMVVNVEIDRIFSTSLRVSWDRLDIPEITRYIVYYS